MQAIVKVNTAEPGTSCHQQIPEGTSVRKQPSQLTLRTEPQ